MRIVVTDSGTIWNHENPYLEQYKDAVVVVCLSGKKVTDKYECFISPYTSSETEEQDYGLQSAKYRALASVAENLNDKICRLAEDILFLTDNNPETLYPFYTLKNKATSDHHHVHLCTFSPWAFEVANIRKTHELLLNDLSSLRSIFYWDSNDVLLNLPPTSTLPNAISDVKKQYGELLPKIIRGIYSIKHTDDKYFFDFASESYIPMLGGFSYIDITKKAHPAEPLDFGVGPCTALGSASHPIYPNTDEWTRTRVETPPPRLDGKKICNILREQRISLANANHIPFESEECPSIGPCAGTCAKCDEELAYLTEKIMEIPEEQRIYPQFDPEWEVIL